MPRRMGFGGGSFGAARITRLLVVLCVGVTLASAVSANWFGADRTLSWFLGLRSGNAAWLYPFVTYVLPHDSYHPLHIVLNMVMLWFLGRDLEVRLGRGRFLALFFGGAIAGALGHVLLGLVLGRSTGLLMGASGGIFALIFFVARETPHRQFVFYFIPIPARVLAFLLLVLEVYPLVFHGLEGGVAHACHLAGAGYGWVFQRHPLEIPDFAARWRAARARRASEAVRRESAADDAEMDRILAKIGAHGMPSLSERERRFLEQRGRELRENRR